MEQVYKREQDKLIKQLNDLHEGPSNDELISKLEILQIRLDINFYQAELKKAVARNDIEA